MLQQLKKKKNKELILNIINVLNIIDFSKKQLYFIYFNNYNYNNNFLVGNLILFNKKKMILETKKDKIRIKLNLLSPIIYFIYKC